MIDFFKRLFGQGGSSSTAKERLRLVLMTDHIALGPEIVDQMKRDLIDVISRYVEVDRDKVEVSFEREDRALAMMANIPILAVARPNAAPPQPPAAQTPAEPTPAAQAPAAQAPAAQTPAAQTPSAGPAASDGSPQDAPPPVRRRRRKKARAASAAAGATLAPHAAPPAIATGN